ncbi:MAG TPA: PA14 domain-containing protein [Actinomycetota bacterium]|nr:PA14 domain-containing protein [Actinomycetota bacterium]
MTGRRIIACLGLVAIVAATALSPLPAAAHHKPGPCYDEAGIWTKSNRALSGLSTREQMVDVKIHTPPPATCETTWQTRWWRRTSTDYSVIPFPKAGDVEAPYRFIDFTNFSVNGQTDYINARITGDLTPPSTQSVNLYVMTSGGVRVWLDNVLVIDEWHDVASPTMYWYPTPVLSSSVKHPVVIEHYHKTGQQKLQLHWKTVETDIVMPGSFELNVPATQHSAVHARSADDESNCTETVAYRMSDGTLKIWGYGCIPRTEDDTDGDDEVVTLENYQPEWITLWQKWNGTTNPSTWGHWYYRWDLKKWYYLGSTGPRPPDLFGWLESSGYNHGSRREAAFDNYREGGSYVDVSTCPETQDFDAHQEMDPLYSPIGGRFFPSSTNSC